MSRYVVQAPRLAKEKKCTKCMEIKCAASFSLYSYTTNQGKKSKRLDSTCRECRSKAKRDRRSRADIRGRDQLNCRKWKALNKKRVLEYRALYQNSEHGRRVKASHQRARKMKLKAGAVDLTDQEKRQIREIYDRATLLQQKLRACVISDDPLDLQVHVDHVIPLSKGGRHKPDNLQLLTGRENIDKGVSLCLDM